MKVNKTGLQSQAKDGTVVIGLSKSCRLNHLKLALLYLTVKKICKHVKPTRYLVLNDLT